MIQPTEASNRAGFWNASHPAGDAGSREKLWVSADTIIAFAIAHAIRECPEVLEAEVLQVAALSHGRR